MKETELKQSIADNIKHKRTAQELLKTIETLKATVQSKDAEIEAAQKLAKQHTTVVADYKKELKSLKQQMV